MLHTCPAGSAQGAAHLAEQVDGLEGAFEVEELPRLALAKHVCCAETAVHGEPSQSRPQVMITYLGSQLLVDF